MAIWGLGAFYSETGDVTQSFLSHGVGCIGWDNRDAPDLHRLLSRIRIGDIIYLKAHPPSQGLIIKAVGIVINDHVHPVANVGEACITVNWVWSGNVLVGRVRGKYNVRNNTLFEEINLVIQKRVVGLLLSEVNVQ